MSLPAPIGRQRDVLYFPPTGHTVVVGTAGSGKTLVAILRAQYLANRKLDHGGPTLLLTPNKSLVAYLKGLATTELAGVQVETFQKFAAGYLGSLGLFPRKAVPGIALRLSLIHQAIAECQSRHPNVSALQRPIDFFDEEVKWIAQTGVASGDDYVDIKRTGRGSARLLRAHKPAVFDVYATYRRLRADAGFDVDWDETGTAILAALTTDTRPRKFRHVVIDEGQDVGPQMLRALVEVVDPAGSVTFFGDYAQQIYGTRMSWRQAGLNIRKEERFAENYRNSRAIAALALAVADMDYFADVPDLVAPTDVVADGPPPTVVACGSPAAEAELAATVAKQNLARDQSVAILVRRRNQEVAIRTHLPDGWVRLDRDMSNFGSGAGIYLGTYHAAKGMEFDSVILPHCSADRFPAAADVEAFGESDARAHDGRLFYVGVTRAKTDLVITYCGQPSSLIPPNTDLYQEHPE